jgi:hypothetical protein
MTDPAVAAVSSTPGSSIALFAKAALVALCGAIPLAVAWYLLAPRVPVVVRAGGIYPAVGEPEQYFAADMTYALLGVAVGAAAGAVGWWRWRRSPRALALGLGVGGLLAGWLGAWLAEQPGPGSIQAAAHEHTAGGRFDAPLTITAEGVMVLVAVGAVALVAALLVGSRRDDGVHTLDSAYTVDDGGGAPISSE